MTKKVLPGFCALAIVKSVIYAAKGYKIFRSTDGGENWELDGRVKDPKYALIANVSRLLARLLRTEITDLLVLEDGTRIAVGKKGIFVASPKSKRYVKTFSIPRGTRPLNLCADSKESLFFGEYLSNPQRDKVQIYTSRNSGRTWEICYTFSEKSIRHVHGIFYDPFEDQLWFATGDLDGECLIGNTKDGFKTVNIVKKGGQSYRTVQLLFYKDFIVYGTDTEYEKNYIYRIDRKDYTEHCMNEISGSVLSAVGGEGFAALATAVEPSEVNRDIFAHIWFSRDGLEWTEVLQYEKDFLNQKYFQYGRVKFPRNGVNENELYFSGHALKRIDNKTVICSLTE